MEFCKACNTFSIGIDIGSTTAKVVVMDENGKEVYGEYRRHFADVRKTVMDILTEVHPIVGDAECTIAVTGSGGLSLAKHLNVEFVQEVIAVATAVKARVEGVDCVIELGGEDAKIIFMSNGIEQRMNGICAGGTGAFIDQMAALLQTDASGLNEYAKDYKELYPIAARCGVFAKSDIQPLINDGVSKADLAASIFQAVVNQTISGLACGRRITGRVVFLGGPLYFLSELQKAFVRTLKLSDENAVFPENAHLFAARGSAMRSQTARPQPLAEVIQRLANAGAITTEMNCLDALFEDEADYEKFKERMGAYTLPKGDLSSYEGNCYLGVDAGSTTMKMALISENAKLLFSYYGSNMGDPVAVCKKALIEMIGKMNPKARIAYACSTGYGEELLKNAFSLDEGEVETISHFYAARYFEPEVDSILDIGGQDMKCISIKDGCVDNIILNEACSSGCGSFIENFANSLGCTAQEFAQKAVEAKRPVDLGTRCTVFMNSNVKQAQKEGAAVEDIAAGLAYSVIKNALFKVIKLSDASQLGEKVVVQGGTFYNDAVLRCFELVSGHEAIRPDIAGLMGAFGAALIAKERCNGRESSMLSESEIKEFTYKTNLARCKGCINQCRLTVNTFSNGKRYISGNRCEKGLGKQENIDKAPNLFEYKKERMFAYEPLTEEAATRGSIGLPRVLNMYEDYPFWAVFFKELGFRVVLSPFSDKSTFERGMDSIPSESECYPAKLVHGHIEWLIAEGVDTIFYPCVYYERNENHKTQNHFNCPMVISYPENIKNNLENLKEKNIRYLNPFIAFSDRKILTENMSEFMRNEFDIPDSEVRAAVKKGWEEQLKAKQDVMNKGLETLKWMERNGKKGIVLAGRPYHLDPEVNHGIPEMIQSFGFAVLTEDSVSGLSETNVKLRATNQWMYHARLYSAAQYVCTKANLEMIQLNSFGCGVDAVTIDQVQELLHDGGKMYTLLKIDEVNNLGAARIRVRSMIAALRMREENNAVPEPVKPEELHDYERVIFSKKMRKDKYTILCTGMTQPHFDFFEAALQACNYDMVLMRSESQNVLDMGLKYVNNDACYPTLITTGQILDEVASGKYDVNRLAVFMVQTGGGCRASNYVGFIRKALADMGYPQIPIISINPGGLETNPGMVYSFKMGFKVIHSLIYGDILMRVSHRMRPYEVVPGTVDKLYKKWHDICVADLRDKHTNTKKFYKNCEDIVREFDEVAIHEDMKVPKVAIVGEVLVKYMPVANNHLADVLEAEGAEVVIPDFIEFISYCFWNSVYRYEHLGGGKLANTLAKIVIKVFKDARKRMMKLLDDSKHFNRPTSFFTVQDNAVEVLQLGNQCGEGWYLAGEVIDLIKEGVDNIVCVQPFGCLPNHVVGKGIIKSIKEKYPQANIVAVDYDPSASKVNQLNRIKLMLEVAREKLETAGGVLE